MEKLIFKVAAELDGDEEELLLAVKVPKPICKRPDEFRSIVGMEDKEMDLFVNSIAGSDNFQVNKKVSYESLRSSASLVQVV